MSIVKLILLIGFISLSIQETELCAIDVVGEGVCRPIGDCASSQIMQGCSKGFGCCMDDSEIGNLEVDSWAKKAKKEEEKANKENPTDDDSGIDVDVSGEDIPSGGVDYPDTPTPDIPTPGGEDYPDIPTPSGEDYPDIPTPDIPTPSGEEVIPDTPTPTGGDTPQSGDSGKTPDEGKTLVIVKVIRRKLKKKRINQKIY